MGVLALGIFCCFRVSKHVQVSSQVLKTSAPKCSVPLVRHCNSQVLLLPFKCSGLSSPYFNLSLRGSRLLFFFNLTGQLKWSSLHLSSFKLLLKFYKLERTSNELGVFSGAFLSTHGHGLQWWMLGYFPSTDSKYAQQTSWTGWRSQSYYPQAVPDSHRHPGTYISSRLFVCFVCLLLAKKKQHCFLSPTMRSTSLGVRWLLVERKV